MKPKHAAGDTVAVSSAIDSTWDINETLILKVEYFGPGSIELPNGGVNSEWGFWYKLSHIPIKNHWVHEESLRILPPPETISFNEMMVDLIGVEV